MNKKAKLYSINKLGFKKFKDQQLKSNEKSLLSKSVERRKKINPSFEQNLDKSQKLKIAPISPKKLKISNNKNKNENKFKGKEYVNTLDLNNDEENDVITPKKNVKNDIINDKNKEKQYIKEKNKSNKYNNNNINKKEKLSEKRIYENKNKKKDDEYYSDEEEKEEINDDNLLYRTLYRTSNKNIDKIKEKEEKIKKNNEKKIATKYENNYDNDINSDKKNFIAMEQTDDLVYNIGDKKIYSNAYNNKNKIPKKPYK